MQRCSMLKKSHNCARLVARAERAAGCLRGMQAVSKIDVISCVKRTPAGRACAKVLSGQLVAPNVPTSAETMEMQRLVDTYGKTFHTWQARICAVIEHVLLANTVALVQTS